MKSNRNTLLLVVVIALFLILFLIYQEGRSGQYEPKAVSSEKNGTVGEKTADLKQESSNYTILVSKNVCEGCHMSGKSSIPQALNVAPHLNGGKYCLSCHLISHQEHPMSDRGVSCEDCHGNKANPEKPVYFNGSISCNNCHNYPDALSPSGGNLITIHRPRDISCNNCHTDDCRKCHTEIGSSERWEKRLAHFKVLAALNNSINS